MPDHQVETPDASDAGYQSYLLRLWQERPGGERRVLLQDVLSGESRWFASLEALFAHLRADPKSQKKPLGSAQAGGQKGKRTIPSTTLGVSLSNSDVL